MPVPTISEFLNYANLQMAAEAFLFDEQSRTPKNGPQLLNALKAGNDHASLFTQTQAESFTKDEGWTVLDQISNTPTGFSGKLFKNSKTDELVISFRSTEFIDDYARDNQATNQLEIKNTGFAFGQLSDMEAWYQSLVSKFKLAPGSFSVTGYSLGGHLATAFNLMHPDAALQVINFTGAGAVSQLIGLRRRGLS